MKLLVAVAFSVLLVWPATAQTVVSQKVRFKPIARNDGMILSCGLRFDVHYRLVAYEPKTTSLAADLSMQLAKVSSGTGYRPILKMILIGQTDPHVFYPISSGHLVINGRAFLVNKAGCPQPAPAFCGEYGINETHEILDKRPFHVGFTIVHQRGDRQASDVRLPVTVDEPALKEFYRCGVELLDVAEANSKGKRAGRLTTQPRARCPQDFAGPSPRDLA